MLTPSEVLQYIELRLGASIQVLELTEDEIMHIVETQTIPSFSHYYPYYHIINVNAHDDRVPNRINAYYLKTDLEILGVSKLLVANYIGSTGLPLAYYDSDPVNRQISADLTSMFVQPITFNFEAPNVVSVYPKTNLVGNFDVEIKAYHPSHLATIPLGLREEFLACALFDVRIALYPIRQRFSTINTTFGNIELFMDKLESAEDDKKQLMEHWRESYLKSPRKRKIFIA